MYKKADNDHDQTGRECAEACSTKEAPSGPNGDDDEYDLQPFEHHGLEARKPRHPIEPRFVTRLIAKLFRLGCEGYCLIVQRNDSSSSQHRLTQPAHAEQ